MPENKTHLLVYPQRALGENEAARNFFRLFARENHDAIGLGVRTTIQYDLSHSLQS